MARGPPEEAAEEDEPRPALASGWAHPVSVAAGGSAKVEVDGSTVGEVLTSLETSHPGFKERILEQVRLTGGARVSDLVELLDVSDMTIRRDIAALARRGLVARVHGGATAISGRSADEPGTSRPHLREPELAGSYDLPVQLEYSI